MIYVVLGFGILIALVGSVLLVKPDLILSQLQKYGESPGLHTFAVIIRILLGLTLVVGASDTHYPVLLEILGWIVICAALILAALGRERFQNLVAWSVKMAPLIYPGAGVLAILLGCFLIYTVV